MGRGVAQGGGRCTLQACCSPPTGPPPFPPAGIPSPRTAYLHPLPTCHPFPLRPPLSRGRSPGPPPPAPPPLAAPLQVLIDEAAQASEVAALQPLVYGAAAAVLVGDPQQLPATLFSAGAREVQMERSLFERLGAAGCPVRARPRAGARVRARARLLRLLSLPLPLLLLPLLLLLLLLLMPPARLPRSAQ